MKSTSPFRSRHFRFVCALLVLVTGLIVASYSSHAQITCYLPTHLISLTPRWEPGQPVTVIYDQNSNFSTAQKESMTKAFKNWNAWNGVWGHNTGVEFVGFEVGAAPNYDTSSRTVHVLKGADNTFTDGVADWFSFGSGPYPTVARIRIKQSWTVTGNPLIAAMAHEIGHSFRLADCYPVCNATSVWVPQDGYFGQRRVTTAPLEMSTVNKLRPLLVQCQHPHLPVKKCAKI